MENIESGRVIITSSRHIMALVIARSLGKKNIEIIGADCISMTMVAMSKYVQHHETYTNYLTDEKGFLDDLEKIVHKYKPKDQRPYLLIPVFKETLLIAQHTHRFEPYIQIACPPLEAINSIFPKDNFTRTAQKYHVQIPPTYLPKQRDELSHIAQACHFPQLIKPYNDSGGRGIQKVTNPEELYGAFEMHLQNYPQPPLIQELIPGENYCLTAIFQKGKLVASMAYKNLLQFPADNGSGVMRVTVNEQPFIYEAIKLFRPIRWNGVVQMDFIWDEDPNHTPYMIEVNPRFWGGLYQSVQSGIDYPWLIYLLYTHRQISQSHKPMLGKKTKIPAVYLIPFVQTCLDPRLSSQNGENALTRKRKNVEENYHVGIAFNTFLKRISYSLHSFRNTFISLWQDARSADNEIFDKEDPGATIGMIYPLFYFLKYRKIPPELG